ncbi:MAG: hypothetical protein AAGF23_17790 [Acidobacteriota bacterium]
MAVSRHSGSRGSLAALGLGLALLLASAPASAQTPRTYKTGKDAIDAKQWASAEKAMRAAIAEDPEAKRRLLTRYTPYYYLGISLAEQGQCRGALEAWRQTDRYGALREGGDEAQDLARRRTRCSKLVDDVKKVVATTEEAVEGAEEAEARLMRLSRQESLQAAWAEGSPSFAARTESANRTLSEARAKLEKGNAELNLDLLAESGYQAAEAMRAFESTLKDAESKLAAANAALSGATSVLSEAETEARTLLRRVRRIRPYPPKLGAQVAQLRRVIEQSDAQRDTADVATLEALAESMRREIAALKPLAVRPPASLQDAAAAFLANDFQGVLDLLAAQEYRSNRARYHAGLLQAAALFGLYVAGGEVEDDLLASGRVVIRDIDALGEGLGQPGERFYSPRFRQFFAETLAAPADEDGIAEDGASPAAEDGASPAAEDGASPAAEDGA